MSLYLDNALILDYVPELLLLVLWEMTIFMLLAKSVFKHVFHLVGECLLISGGTIK